MSSFDLSTPVGEIVARYPSTSRIFDRAGVDFCCGGKRSLAEACRVKGLPAERLVAELEAELATIAASADEPDSSLVDAPLPALARYIVERFHVPLREELPRLGRMAERVLEAHGRAHPELVPELARIVRQLQTELEEHMLQEESVLFPAIEALAGAAGEGAPQIAKLIATLEGDHDGAGAALTRLRELTGGFVPPVGACNTFRALYDGLAHFESEMHLHVHLENSVLFPRAAAAERELELNALFGDRPR